MKLFVHAVVAPFAALLALSGVTGCQMSPSVPAARLIQHQAMVDLSGLADTTTVDELKVHIATPRRWEPMTVAKKSSYLNMQWRSPSQMTGVGVAYVKMPLPFPAKAVAWLAQREYSKRADDGKILGTWQDDLGRPWFEAQNSKYHIRGYVVTRGWEAWIIYCGYKREQPPSAPELNIAARALETIVPTPIAEHVPQRPVAQTPRSPRNRG